MTLLANHCDDMKRNSRSWFHVQAHSPDGVSRCYGEADNFDDAYGQCKIAAMEYLAKRKDIERLLIPVGDQVTIITPDGVLI